MSVSIHGDLSWGGMVGLVSPKNFRQASTFTRQQGLWVCCRTRRVAVVCRGFISVVLSDSPTLSSISTEATEMRRVPPMNVLLQCRLHRGFDGHSPNS